MTMADVIDIARQAGTLSMQALMLLGLIVLGWWHRHMHNENKLSQKSLIDRLDAKEAAISTERLTRISQLMLRMEDDTKAKVEMTGAIQNNSEAIKANSTAILELRNFMQEELREHRDFVRELALKTISKK